jgi:hypothetical protein
MLEFYARDYLEIANRFGRVLAAGKEPDPDVLKDLWTDLYSDTERLELPVTREHIASLILELLEREPGKVDLSSGRFDVSASLSIAIIQPHVETIYKTLRAELGSLRLRVIPREK